jgi:hypothetical protein
VTDNLQASVTGTGNRTNLYAYVGNDPLNVTDPLGLWTLQLGFSFSGALGPLSGSFSVGVVVDLKGNFAGYLSPALSGSAGAYVKSGVSGAVSSADTIYDLASNNASGFNLAGLPQSLSQVSNITSGTGIGGSIDLSVGKGINGSEYGSWGGHVWRDRWLWSFNGIPIHLYRSDLSGYALAEVKMHMAFPFLIHGKVQANATAHTSEQAVLEKLAKAIKREGGSNIVINGKTIEFVGVTGQGSVSPLVNIERSTITVNLEPSFVCLRYVARPERWPAYMAVIVILIGIVTWLISIFPLRLTAGFGLALLIIWVAYVPILRLRFESFLRRSVSL